MSSTLRTHLRNIFAAGIEAVDPVRVVKETISIPHGKIVLKGARYPLDQYKHVYVVGGGKASGAMAQAIEALLGENITSGIINVLEGTGNRYTVRRITLNEASHPIPNQQGVNSSKNIMNLVQEAGQGDLVIALISGGGSALMTLPAVGISLDDMRKTTARVMEAGATINELNAVRKHISRIKGGQLAKRAHPAEVLTLIISDVMGDPPDVVASGPTAPDSSTFQDARQVLSKYELWGQVPSSVTKRITQGVKGQIPETPKPSDPTFEKVNNVIIANNRTALNRAVKKADTLGYSPKILTGYLEGEARHVGKVVGSIALEIKKHETWSQKPVAVLGGGETTVTVRGDGKGGRNQELALGAAVKITGKEGILIGSIDTDGIDGNSNAAGAMVDGETIRDARAHGLDPADYLEANDSYGFFKQVGDLIVTGPTDTNVNDLLCILVA